MNVDIVHRDAHLLVLAKPSGLPTTHPEGGDCLAKRAKELDPGAPRLHASSRLDADVTGLVTFARTREGNAMLRAARRESRYGRLYLALAPAHAPPSLGSVWDEAIGLHRRDPRKRRAAPKGTAGAKAALTHPELRAFVKQANGGLALLALRPATGRTHQLRVHAATHELPLLGDVHYGGEKRLVLDDGRVLTARRTMLHCAALDLPSMDGAGITLTLEPPDDFASLWTGAGGTALDLRA